MKNKYQIEYENTTDCFWAKEPAKYVKVFIEKYCSNLHGLTGLDLGAGEGKNAVYLASKGAKVYAVDVSPIALSRFNQQPNYDSYKENIGTICCDMRNVYFPNETFDFVVAYGILHCLSNKKEVKEYVDKIKSWIKPKGFFICVTFTDEVPPPDSQSYLEYESFLEKGMLEEMFSNWKILEKENDIIAETHPTCNVEHKHSLIRLIAYKDE